jgi:3-oxoacyl-[acyl-carrier protein] reductase
MSKVILITGTSRGIGRYLLEQFDGQYIYGCTRDTSDVSSEVDVLRMFNYIIEDSGKIDILINNAGVASMNSSLLTTCEKAMQIINTNFIGTFLCSREAAKIMLKQKYGRIINISSIGVGLDIPGEAVYLASKAAIETLTKVMAKELNGTGITVNCIRPGIVETDLTKHLPDNDIPKTTFENIYRVITEIIESNETGTIRPA